MRRTLSFPVWVLACVWMVAAVPAHAQIDEVGSSTYRVVPAQPTTRHAIAIRNDFTGCRTHGPNYAQEIRVDLDARIVDYLIAYGNDEAGCAPQDYRYDTFADSVVGQLPAGTYTVRFFSCGILYDPPAGCDELASPRLQFVVAEAGSRHTIPAASNASRLALLAVLALAAAWRLRRS